MENYANDAGREFGWDDEIQNEEIRNGLLHTLLGKENHLVSNHLCII